MRISQEWRQLFARHKFVKSAEERERIRAQVMDASKPRAAFYLLVVLSTTIAAFGLLSNSTAVVIGAMLVAPLMGPIFGMGLALTTGNWRMLAKAGAAEIAGVILCIALAALIGAVTVYPNFSPEILSRTKPTLYDIFIAIASGLAGSYALVDERIGPTLPGVAIATALVPPLVSCGLCLSAGQWEWALGAFLLFFANFLAIELAASLIFLLAGLGKAGPSEKFTAALLFRRFGLSIVLFAAIAVFMTRTLLGLVSEIRYSEALRVALLKEVRSSTGASLSEVQFHKENGRTNVIAVIFSPQEFLPEQVARIEGNLRENVDPQIRLVIRSLITKDVDRKGPVFITHVDQKRREEAIAQTSFLARINQALTEGLDELPGTRLVNLRQETTAGLTQVTAVVRTPVAINPKSVAKLQAALYAKTGVPLRLTVHSVLTLEADAVQYLPNSKR